MSQPPTTFGQLLCRLVSPGATTAQQQAPMIASATEIAQTSAADQPPLWVILHSVTDSDLRMIHGRPVAARELAVQFRADGGEILRVTLAMADSQKKGELYESTAQFIQ